MTNSIDYNVFNLSLNNGLENHAISSGKDYIILLKAPVNANVKVRLNSNQGDLIPLKENYAIKASNVKEIFITADIVENEVITIGQSNSVDGFEIITAPTINSIEEIGILKEVQKVSSFDNTLLTQLDKIINPYEYSGLISGSFNGNTSLFEVLNIIIPCDKIIVNLQAPFDFNSGKGVDARGLIYLFLDNEVITLADANTYSPNYSSNNKLTNFVIEGCKGKNLVLKGVGTTTTKKGYYSLQKFNLKD